MATFDRHQDRGFNSVALCGGCEWVENANEMKDLNVAELSQLGFNFYKEAIFVKSAAIASVLKINIGGKQIPYEKDYNVISIGVKI